MEEIEKRLDEISDLTDHYLIIARNNSDHYYNEFIEASKIIKNVISEKEFEFWCSEKMLLKQQVFAEKTFIQYAVETSAARFFAEKYNENFKVEAKINPTNDKDVDIQFTNRDFKYNVEVKCSDFVSKEKIEVKDAFKYETVGRIPDRQETKKNISTAIDEGLENKGEETKPHLDAKNMDNNLKDFLELSHEKFNPTPNENEVNILLVGCDDERDIQKWHYYLFAEQGLFTAKSFADREKYKNVDLVVFTNLYFKHNKYFDKNVRNSWTLENSFNLIFSNPFRLLQKEKAIKNFLDIFPHFTWDLSSYSVPGDAPSYVKDSVRISWFVKDNLEKNKGLYLFNEKE
jgi:hypothetical protein